MQFSANVAELSGSAALDLTALSRQLRAQGRNILDLSAGEPDFRTPAFAGEAGMAAIEQGFTHYAPVAGLPALREAVAQQLARLSGKRIDASRIVITPGARQALFNACFSLFGPGDDVLIPVPWWTSYPDIVRLARARPVFVRPGDEAGLRLTTADLAAALTPRTRGLILNSPANPTGVTYSLEELDGLVRWAAEHGITVIADELYRHICFTADRAPSVLDLDDSLLGSVVLVDGASEAFAMTGWRIGFSCSTPERAAVFAALQGHTTAAACTPAQYAALAAYRDETRVSEAVTAMVRVFHRRRDSALARLRERLPGTAVIEPQGTFYLYLRVAEHYREGMRTSTEFCTRLLQAAGVLAVPGSAFGDDGCIRLSLAAPEAEIIEGIDRLVAAVAAPGILAG